MVYSKRHWNDMLCIVCLQIPQQGYRATRCEVPQHHNNIIFCSISGSTCARKNSKTSIESDTRIRDTLPVISFACFGKNTCISKNHNKTTASEFNGGSWHLCIFMLLRCKLLLLDLQSRITDSIETTSIFCTILFIEVNLPHLRKLFEDAQWNEY